MAASSYPAPFPPPEHDLPWCLVLGNWGDVLTALGAAKFEQEQSCRDQVGIVWHGTDRAIPRLIEAQPWVREVRAIHAADKGVFARRCQVYAWENWTDHLIETAGVTYLHPTHAPFRVVKENPPIHHLKECVLPEECEAWAFEQHYGRDEVLVQAQSRLNTSFADHWPGWQDAYDWLADTPFGDQVWDLDGAPPTPTMMHVFALANLCRAVVTTSNSLAHWCRIKGIPAAVVMTRHMTKANWFYRHLRAPHLRLVEFTDGLGVFQRTVAEVLG